MELELGLKITKTRDDIASTSEYRLAMDRAGPIFQSRETNTMFILTAHLKGYKRNNIVIKISEDGSKISISGEKPIQEMLMVGWVTLKEEVEITGFNKVFKIPDGVVLDRIKAKYDEKEWILEVVMPKSVKGICGASIEEVKEEEYGRGKSEIEKSEAGHILKSVGETSQKGSKGSEVQEMKDSESVMEKKKGRLSENMLDDANRDTIGDTIKNEIEKSKLGIKDGKEESVRENISIMKTSELEQNVGASIPQKIEDISLDEESEDQKMDSEIAIERKEVGISDKMLDDIGENIIEEVIPKARLEESEGLNVSKMQETKEAKEAMAKRKGKDIEYFVEKGEGEEPKRMHVEVKTLPEKDIIKETRQEKIEKLKNGSEDSDQQNVQENNVKGGLEVSISITEELPNQVAEKLLDRSERFKAAKEEFPMKMVDSLASKRKGLKDIKVEEAKEVTSKMGMEPPRMVEITPNKGTEESQTEKMSLLPVEVQRKEPHELSCSSMDHEIPKREEVQQEKGGERLIHAPQATTSKEGLAQTTATHSKANVEPKGDEIDKPQTNQLPSPSIEILSKDAYELDKVSMETDDSKVENLPQVRGRKKSTDSMQGTTASEAVADKVEKPSKISSSSSPQQVEDKEKYRIDASYKVGNQASQESKKKDPKVDVQKSTNSKTDQEVEQVETLQPEFPIDQQCINEDQEQSHQRHEIEEEKSNEQGVEACEEISKVLEKAKEGKEEARGGKKDDTKRSKKLFVPLVIAGSALLVSLIVIFVRNRRARKSTK